MENITKQITINGKTKSVEFSDVWGDGKQFRSNGFLGLYRKHGGKKWAGYLTLWQKPDGNYRLAMSETFLNRNGYLLIDWNEQSATSNHNSAIPNR